MRDIIKLISNIRVDGKEGQTMLSKKTQKALDTITNIYKIVQETQEKGYPGTMEQLIIEAVKRTALERNIEYDTVKDSLTRGLGINGQGSSDYVYKLIEEACINKDENHQCDDLLNYLIESMNGNDDSEDELRIAYGRIFE